MTVRELIAQLQEEDPDRVVILQSDPEGNSFSPLREVWVGGYRAETPRRGEMGPPSDGVPALVLVPAG